MLHDVATADLRQRSAAGCVWSHARTLLVSDRGFNVTFQLLVELAFNALLLEERFQAGSKVGQPIHGVLRWVSVDVWHYASRMREMAAIWRCHCSVSLVRAFRPFAVSR